MNTNDQPQSRRRRFRFTLRTFFILLTIFCLWFGWQVDKARKQRAAVAWCRAMGATVVYDYEWDDDKGILENVAHGVLDNLLGIDMTSKVVWVNLSSTPICDISPLADLPDLDNLQLSGTDVRDISALRNMKNLVCLDLDSTKVRDLTPLSSLKRLHSLELRHTKVNDLCPLSNLPHLTYLNLKGTPVRDISPLSNLRSLEHLYLDHTDVDSISALSGLQHLHHLSLRSTPITTIQEVRCLQGLVTLDISSTSVRDISAVSENRTLEVLIISETRVTDLSPLLELPAFRHIVLGAEQLESPCATETLSTMTGLFLISIYGDGISRNDALTFAANIRPMLPNCHILYASDEHSPERLFP